MTIDYVNSKYDNYSISVDRSDISFSTMFWVVKGMHNDNGVVNKYTNLMLDEVKRN